jgi:hypothetical protein
MESLMEGKQPRLREKTWKPVTGGTLAIVAGYVNILLGIAAWMGAFNGLTFLSLASITSGLGIGIGIVMAAFGIVSVIGGSFSLARRGYPVALIGSIAALFPSPALVPGVLSVLSVGLGRSEFKMRRA